MPDPVRIVPYDPQWPALFSALGARLRDALGTTALRIDHIGSTAVPELAAKPIIDVQISVAAFEPLDAFRVPIESLGFAFRPSNPDKTKRYFREIPGERRTHIHVCRAGSWRVEFALLFRDYLRTHDDDAKRYAELKYKLAKQYGADRHDYTEAKTPFIWETMMKADRWNQEIGWQPGLSDV